MVAELRHSSSYRLLMARFTLETNSPIELADARDVGRCDLVDSLDWNVDIHDLRSLSVRQLQSLLVQIQEPICSNRHKAGNSHD